MIRIEWHHEKSNGHTGKVNGVHLFTVHNGGVNYLTTELPIEIPTDMTYTRTPAEAEENAEIVLATFLGTIGAQWKSR